MTPKKKPLVLGFGHRARQGKDEAARTIVRERGSKYKIAVIAFADALRKEVNDKCEELISTGMACSYEDALAIMCLGWDAEFDENAVADEMYPHGKQRDLLQAIGDGRRQEEPDYWITRWKQAFDATDADIVIITDMRYPNEMELLKSLGGQSVRFTRLGYTSLSPKASAHITEIALNDATFDHDVRVRDGQIEKLQGKTLALFDYLVNRHLRTKDSI